MSNRVGCKHFKVGDYLYNNEGYRFQIIEYENARNVIIQWDCGQTDVGSSGNIIRGRVRYFNHKGTCGIGFLGYGKYVVEQKRLQPGQEYICPVVYQKWRQLLERCYNLPEGNPYYNAYKDCFVDDEWHNFQNFSEWMIANEYAFNIDVNNRPWCLDKDILIQGNNKYSKDTCVFVPNEVNVFFSRKEMGSTGRMGVNLIKPKSPNGKKGYTVRCSVGGKRIYLGYYNNLDDAENEYFKCKDNASKILSNKWAGLVDRRVVDVLSSFNSRKWFSKEKEETIQ